MTFSLPPPPNPAVPAHLHKVPINTFSLSYLRSLNSLPAREPASRRPLAPRGAAPLTLAPRAARGGLDPARPAGAGGRPRGEGRALGRPAAQRGPRQARGRALREKGRRWPPLLQERDGEGGFSWETRGVEIPRSSSSGPRTPPPPRHVPSPLPSHLFRSAAPRQTRLSSLPPLPSPLPKLSTPPPGGRDFWRQLPPGPKPQLSKGPPSRPPLPRSEGRWGCR